MAANHNFFYDPPQARIRANAMDLLIRQWRFGYYTEIDPIEGVRHRIDHVGWILRYCANNPDRRIHPAVRRALGYAWPRSLATLARELPYVSVKDTTRLAYTPDDRAGEADRQLITTVGRYLRRHWPQLPDDVIRDIAAPYITASRFEIRSTQREIVQAAQKGPRSCMQWDDDDAGIARCDDVNEPDRYVDGDLTHPYEVYDPRLGWHVAVRIKGNRIDGRALVWDPCRTYPDTPRTEVQAFIRHMGGTADVEQPFFVRSFARPEADGGWSHPDDTLHGWLKEQGYKLKSSWEGVVVKFVPDERDYDRPFMPYLDGNAQYASETNCGCSRSHPLLGAARGMRTLCIDDAGTYRCDNTDGSVDTRECVYCDNCEDALDYDGEDDPRYAVGRDEDQYVCRHCRDNDYTWVRGRRGRRYYVHNDDVLTVGGYDFDGSVASEIDELTVDYKGEYILDENAIYCEETNEYYDLSECTYSTYDHCYITPPMLAARQAEEAEADDEDEAETAATTTATTEE